MTVHVSLDLETWGTRAGCDIRSIGAVVFYPETGKVCDPRNGGADFSNSFYIACENPIISDLQMGQSGGEWYTLFDTTSQCWRKYPLKRDPATVQWWNDQSAEAKGAFIDPVDLSLALARFSDWLTGGLQQPSELRLWSHGASFDPPILEAAYHAVGQVVPWHYRSPRDTRTAFDLVGIEDHTKWLKQFATPGEVYHHALDDAIVQARAICAAYAAL